MSENKEYEATDYLSCREPLNKLGFSDEEISKAIEDSGNTKESLTDRQTFKEKSHATCIRIKEYLGSSTHHYKEYNGNYEKSCRCNGVAYRVPAHHQGLRHGEIIFSLLKNRYSWFDSFKIDKNYSEKPLDEYFYRGLLDLEKLPEELKSLTVTEIIARNSEKEVVRQKSAWSLYEMYSNSDYEIYLTTENGSLYVPIEALINCDFKLIKDRVIEYSDNWYDLKSLSGFALNHRGRTKKEYRKDQEEAYTKSIAVLDSKEADLLKSYFEQELCKKNK